MNWDTGTAPGCKPGAHTVQQLLCAPGSLLCLKPLCIWAFLIARLLSCLQCQCHTEKCTSCPCQGKGAEIKGSLKLSLFTQEVCATFRARQVQGGSASVAHTFRNCCAWNLVRKPSESTTSVRSYFVKHSDELPDEAIFVMRSLV